MKPLWRARVERDFGITDGDWNAVNYDEIDWRHWSDAEKRDLYATMTSGILNVTLRNGIEARVAVAHADHPGVASIPFLRWMATEMQLGELEAEVMAIGARPWPPTPVEEWHELRDQMKAVLEDIQRNSTLPTKGHAALGQNKHADLALNALERLEHLEVYYAQEAGTGLDPEFIREAIFSAAHLGFAIGQHAYASTHKPFERKAVTGEKLLAHLDDGRERQNSAKRMTKAQRRARIVELLPTTTRKGSPLVKWLIETLRSEGFGSVSRPTIYRDLQAIVEKVSHTG